MNKELKAIITAEEFSPADCTKAMAFIKEQRMAKRANAKEQRDALKAQLAGLVEKRNRGGEAAEGEEKPRKKSKKGKRNRGE